MRRSRGFVLSEILVTILLQAEFLLVLCGAFYLFLDFYSRSQQVLTARNHAQRVIQFMDDKIRNAGLGLWRYEESKEIREALGKIKLLATSKKWDGKPQGYRLPVSLSWIKDGLSIPPETKVLKKGEIMSGDLVVLLYAQRNSSESLTLTVGNIESKDGNDHVSFIDSGHMDETSFELSSTLTGNEGNIKSYTVAESIGIPVHIAKSSKGYDFMLKPNVGIPLAAELMYLNCMQVFIHDAEDGNGRQLAFHELKSDGTDWYKTYHQEKNILEIYMTLDPSTNIFTLYVLATGGYDKGINNPRPESWPKEANWNEDEYPHHIVYVSRKSWKLRNIPDGFSWN